MLDCVAGIGMGNNHLVIDYRQQPLAQLCYKEQPVTPVAVGELHSAPVLGIL